MIVAQEKQVLLKMKLEVQMWGSGQRLKMWKELCKNVILICLLEQILNKREMRFKTLSTSEIKHNHSIIFHVLHS